MTDPLGAALLGAPGERPPANPVLSRLLGREVAVLIASSGEELFP
jgi:hypothetical protein